MRKPWRTTVANPAVLGPLLRQAGFVASDADPEHVRVSLDAVGRVRRISARYAGGWRAVLHVGRRSQTLVQSLQISVGRP